MSYKQRSTEFPTIKPFGFTGIISQNSNITIDKTYVKGGTSFINAFKNSNAILKDCGSPEPKSLDSEKSILSQKTKLSTEKDSINLPPWIHYKIKNIPVGDKDNIDIDTTNKFIIYSEHIRDNINDDVKKLRDKILNSVYMSEHNELIASSDLMLEKSLPEHGISTYDTSVTVPGVYILSGVESSIRAVWPLDNINKINVDNPSLNLHFVKRLVFPMLNKSKKEIKIEGIEKIDEFGDKFPTHYNHTLISKNTHKYIVSTISNQPEYSNVNIRLNNIGNSENNFYFKLEKANDERYYFMGPYLNDRKYICYYKYNKASQNLDDKILVNDENGKETTFWFKFNDKTYSLYEYVNNYYKDDTENIKKLNETYDLSSRFNSSNCTFKIDSFSKESILYQPEGNYETCNFIGFKYKGNSNSSVSLYDTIYKEVSNGKSKTSISVENEILSDKNSIFPENIRFYRSFKERDSFVNINKSLVSSLFIYNANLGDDNENINKLYSSILENSNLSISSEYNCSGILKKEKIKKYDYIIYKNRNKELDIYKNELNNLIKNITINNVSVDFKEASHEVNLKINYNNTIRKVIINSIESINQDKFTSLSSKITPLKQSIYSLYTSDDEDIPKSYSPDSIIIKNTYDFNNLNINDLTSLNDITNQNIAKKLLLPDKNFIAKLNEYIKTDISSSYKIDSEYRAYYDNYHNILLPYITDNSLSNTDESLYVYEYDSYLRKSVFKKIEDIQIEDVKVETPETPETQDHSSENPTIFSSQSDEWQDGSEYFKEIPNKKIMIKLSNELKFKCDLSDLNDLHYSETSPTLEILDIVLSENDLSKLIKIKSRNSSIETDDVKIKEYLTPKISKSDFIEIKPSNDLNDNLKDISIISSYPNAGDTAVFYSEGNPKINIENAFNVSFKNEIEKECPKKEKIIEPNLDNLSISNINLEFEDINSDEKFIIKFKVSINQSSDTYKQNYFEYDENQKEISCYPFITHYNLNINPIQMVSVAGNDINIEQTISKGRLVNLSKITYADHFDLPDKESIDETPSSLIKRIISNNDAKSILNDKIDDINDVFGKYKNVFFDGVSKYLIVNKIKKVNENNSVYLENDNENSSELYYNGLKITPNMLISDSIIGEYKVPPSKENESTVKTIVLSFDTNIPTKVIDNIILFYDKDCRMPIEFDKPKNTNYCYLYSHDINGKKIYKNINNKSALTIGGKIVKFDYIYMKEFIYETSKNYELANFNDWYDIDSYINYSYLNSNITKDAYSLTYEGYVPDFKSNYSVLNKNTSFILKSNVKSNSFDIVKNYASYNINGNDYNFSSLFSKDNYPNSANGTINQSYQGYKAFSFNFMIPKEGWDKLDDEMYKENNEYEKPLDSIHYKNTIDKIPALENYTYNGNLCIKYRNLIAGEVSERDEQGFSRYKSECVTIPFTAKVRISDRAIIEEDTGIPSELIVSLNSLNESLSFSTYVKRQNKLLENEGNIEETLTNSKLFFEERNLNYFTFDIHRDDIDEGDFKVQFDNIKLFIKYDYDSHNLFLSFITDDENKFKYSSLTPEGLSNFNFDSIINFDLVSPAEDSFIKGFNKDLVLSDNTVLVSYSDLQLYKSLTSEFVEKTYNKGKLQDILNKLNDLSSKYENKLGNFKIDDKPHLIYSNKDNNSDKRYSFIRLYFDDKKNIENNKTIPGCRMQCAKLNLIGNEVVYDTDDFLMMNLSKSEQGWKSDYNLIKDYRINYIRGYVDLKKIASDHEIDISAPFKDKKQKYFCFLNGDNKYVDPVKNTFSAGLSHLGDNSVLDFETNKKCWYKNFKLDRILSRMMYRDYALYNQTDTHLRIFIYADRLYNDYPGCYVDDLHDHCRFNLEYSDNLDMLQNRLTILGHDYLPNIFRVYDGLNSFRDYKFDNIYIDNSRYYYKHCYYHYGSNHPINWEAIGVENAYRDNVGLEYMITYKNIASPLANAPIIDSSYKGEISNAPELITDNDLVSLMKSKYIFGNMLGSSKHIDNYFILWMSPLDIQFIPSGEITDKFILEKNKFPEKLDLNEFVLKPNNEGSPKTSEVLNEEKYCLPFDTSTNLFYYKGSTSEDSAYSKTIKSDDEIVMINARKMYNEMDDEDIRPSDGSLDIELKDLYDTPMTLTAYVDFTKYKPEEEFIEIYPYVDDDFNYIFSESGDDIVDEKYHKVRYTDMLEKSPQWKLYKLNENIEFSTIPGFSLTVTPNSNINSKNEINRPNDNKFKIPCNLHIKFNGFIFKQKLRDGCAFDNVENIDFDSKIISNSLFNNESEKRLSTIKMLANRWGLTSINPKDTHINPIVDGKILSENDDKYWETNESYEQLNGFNKLGFLTAMSTGKYQELPKFGSQDFKNDVTLMVQVNNAVNKWETSIHDTKYSKLRAFSDYAPTHYYYKDCIGTPYLNMEKQIALKIFEDEMHVNNCYYKTAEVAKIATDIKYVNNIKIPNDLNDMILYPVNDDAIEDNSHIKNISSSSIYDYVLDYEVNMKIKNNLAIGLKKLTFRESPSYPFIGGENKNYFNYAIYFDGLEHEKEVYINPEIPEMTIGSIRYNVLSLISNTLQLNDKGILTGNLKFQLVKAPENGVSTTIELHNVKPPAPTIKELRFSFDENVNKNNEYICDNEIWQRIAYLNKIRKFKYDKYDQIYFSLQTNEDVKGSSEPVFDNKGNLKGVKLRIDLKGFRKFKNASMRYKFIEQQQVVLSSETLLNDYKNIRAAFNKKGEMIELGKNPSAEDEDTNWSNDYAPILGYNNEARLGDTVLSGILFSEYNHISTVPLNSIIESVGSYTHRYNPKDKDVFQIEIISKRKNENNFSKDLYYVNLPINTWYNLSIYKYVKTEKNGLGSQPFFGIQLTNINENIIENIASKPKEIFNVFTNNKKILNGTEIKTNIYNVDYFDNQLLCNYKSSYEIEFDPCSRMPWNVYYTNNPKVLANSKILDENEYAKRQSRDLYKLSTSINNINFSNTYSVIKLFNNDEIYKSLNDKKSNFISYNCDAYKTSVNMNSNLINNNKLLSTLINYVPVKISYKTDSMNYYALREKDKTYHIRGIDGMKTNSIMWISSPDLSKYNSQCPYFESYKESLNEVNKYIKYFGNPQHKLPPVKYAQRILNSDYATMVYNSCEKTSGIEKLNNVNNEPEGGEVAPYDYSDDPLTIAYVWDNSQVTRNETYDMKRKIKRPAKLSWVKQSGNEYIAEIGSLYNFQNSETVINRINIETGSITQRQTTLMPVMTSPFDFEKRSNENGVVTINDKIIATSALGYNSNGYPVNGVMVYNSNESVQFDTTQTTYLYVTQNNQQAECKFGATQEKPIYVDTVQENIAAYSEKFEFLPLPIKSMNGETNDDIEDDKLNQYYGGNIVDPRDRTDYKNIMEFGNLSKNELINIFKNEILNENYNDIKKTELANEKYDRIIMYFNYINYSIQSNILTTYSKYDYNSCSIKYINPPNSIETIKVDYMANQLAIKSLNDETLNYSLFNVFFDDETFKKYNNNKDSQKYWETMKCFYFNGELVPSKIITNNKEYDMLSHVSTNKESAKDITNSIKQAYEMQKEGIEIEPSIAISWLPDMPPLIWEDFKNTISKDITNETGVALFDSYGSCNLTGVKLTIKSNHLTTAPVYVKIYLLKAECASDGTKINFVWKHDDLFDIDLRATYSSEYDYSSNADKEIFHQFILMPGKEHLIKNVFGIKFVIKQIVPQNNEFNSCVIDGIKVYTSNMTNPVGQAISVEDIFVRKNEANCRNFYNMKVNEYVWRLPNTVSEWSEVKDILSADLNQENKLINADAWHLISDTVDELSERNRDNEFTVEEQFNNNGKKFSLLNTYFITNSLPGDSVMTDVFSDNYLTENQNMTITWKYVDYVYVYYNCYSTKANFLLDKNFGKAIYSAVRAKLNANIKALNSNSAFNDKFRFRGGIAVAKKDYKDEKRNEKTFEWQSKSWSKVTTDTWEDVTTWDVYGTRIDERQVTETEEKLANGWKVLDSWTRTYTEKSEVLNQKQKSDSSVEYRDVVSDVEKQNSAVVGNPKYKSVDNWIASFEPIMIKYRID